VTFELSAAGIETAESSAASAQEISLREGSKYFVNPGSVGQPRDGDRRAAYAVVDVVRKRIEHSLAMTL
jgi:diadenosine tetraphosphatase ApaH/serine/threonine PP2A family protein phosphatase